MSDLDDVEVYWEIDQLNVDAVSIPGIGSPFSISTFNDFEMDSMAGNPILNDKEPDKVNSFLPVPTIQPPRKEPQPLYWWEVNHSEYEVKVFLIVVREICLSNL